MKKTDTIEDIMLAPCGINCLVCYRHAGIRKSGKPCAGCLKRDLDRLEHGRKCHIINCVKEKGFAHCFACDDFPCKRIKALEKNYNKRYHISLIANSMMAKEQGVQAFLAQDCIGWTCAQCGGLFSLHEGICSECGNIKRANG